jgi:hypothetical protein
MPQALPFLRLKLWLLLAALAAGGCGFSSGAAELPTRMSPTSTPTPFQSLIPTSTAQPVRLWVAPSAPLELQVAVAKLAHLDSRVVEEASSAEQADLRLGPQPDVATSHWIYTLVAPFPTVTDGMSLDQVKLAWTGQGGDPVFASQATVDALTLVLGPADGVRIVASEALVDQAWANRPSLAIVPFQDLEPRWKVLAVDGVSPLDTAFDSSAYALSVDLGWAGTPDLVKAAVSSADLPGSNRDPDQLTTVVVTGVTALTRATAWQMDLHTPTWPADLIGDWLRDADITHVSNEVSFTPDCPPGDPSRSIMRFCTQPKQMALLDAIGVDVIELTGNHELDYGTDPMLYTLDQYDQKGWQYFGGGRNLTDAQQPALFDIHGNKIAFLGCNPAGPSYDWATDSSPGSLPCDMPALMAEVRDLRSQGYQVIFTFQWDEAYRDAPLPTQVEGFHQPADAGAVIVSGSQAHQPMGFEFYQGSMIHYGLGNLFFDQMWSDDTRKEFIDRHVFYQGRYISTQLFAAELEDYAQPRPMTPSERADFLSTLFNASGW